MEGTEARLDAEQCNEMHHCKCDCSQQAQKRQRRLLIRYIRPACQTPLAGKIIARRASPGREKRDTSMSHSFSSPASY